MDFFDPHYRRAYTRHAYPSITQFEVDVQCRCLRPSVNTLTTGQYYDIPIRKVFTVIYPLSNFKISIFSIFFKKILSSSLPNFFTVPTAYCTVHVHVPTISSNRKYQNTTSANKQQPWSTKHPTRRNATYHPPSLILPSYNCIGILAIPAAALNIIILSPNNNNHQ